MGKWGGASFLFGLVITAFVFGGNPLRASYAYMADAVATESYQPTEIVKAGLRMAQETSLSTEFMIDPTTNLNDITLPVNELINDTLNGLKLNQGFNMGTGVTPSPIKTPSVDIDFNRFFSSSRVSSNDVMSFLKEAAITGINLSILIITITAQVLKGLLEVIK